MARLDVGVIGFQMCASIAWITSVVLYDVEWSAGDVCQMAAACFWTVSNGLAAVQLYATPQPPVVPAAVYSADSNEQWVASSIV
eukprot:m.417450 g.417450  ORF g.417450 m.417450 type:complete len:84 (-) comp30449_c0_seq1:236-487(-)